MSRREADVTEPSPLLELFRQEVRDAVQALAAGLPALEAGGDAGALARAAHSACGAARLVGVTPAVRLAAALEDRLAVLQKRGKAADIGPLVAVVSLLGEVADADDVEAWVSANAGRVVEALAGVSAREGAAPTELPAPGPREGEAPAEPASLAARPEPRPPGTAARPEPRPPEAPRPPGRTGPVAAIDVPLLELFREEVRGHAQTLSTGLVALEQAPGDTSRIEPLMRAAHSIKGAARVVNLDAAVRVAHRAEDTLVEAQKGGRVLTPDDIDVLLGATDLLAAMAEAAGPGVNEWLTANQDRVDEMLGRLKGEGAPVAGSARNQGRAPEAATRVPGGPGHGTETPAPPTPPPDPAPEPPAEERVVRVTAQSLSRLMSLAGESLVEARWLQPFAGSLLKLKKQQDQLGAVLDEVWQRRAGRKDEAQTLLEDARRQLAECGRALTDRIGEFEAHSRQSDDLNSRLYREVIASRMRPFVDGTHGFPRLARDLARQLGKQVAFEVRGEATDVDRDILEKLEAPLNHLVRNALDHGLESPEVRREAGKPEAGRLTLEARHNAGMLQITVADDGRGIDLVRLREKVVGLGHTTAEMAARLGEHELLDFLFLPGFSTAETVTDVSGRGVGLDVVHSMVHAVGGRVWVQTKPGRGTHFHLQLPITLSVIRAVLVDVAGEPYAFPLNRIDHLLRLTRDDLRALEGRQYVTVDGHHVGIILARQVFDLPAEDAPPGDLYVVLFSSQTAQYGLVVDGFLGEQDLVVRPLDARLGKVPDISAAALLDDGSPVLIADVEDLTRSIEEILKGGRLRRAGPGVKPEETRPKKRVLVVDDSITVREVERQLLAARGYEVDTAVDGLDGLDAVRNAPYDLVISDIDMPRLNGLDFVRRLKGDSRLHTVPVVIVSYKDREEDRLRGLEAGANYYLTKSSFHDDRLLNVVEELIGEP